MKKLLAGIAQFRQSRQKTYQEQFAHLALQQKPDALMIACSDSRVVPNIFASTDPGDLFVVRNVGNIIPSWESLGKEDSDEAEAAAIEFAVLDLKVSDIIVCGHAECGAMKAILDNRSKLPQDHARLKNWLRHAEDATYKLKKSYWQGPSISESSHLALANVLTQRQHILDYPLVQEKVREGKLKVHGWWFSIKTADVYAFDDATEQFVIIDETFVERALS